MKIHTRPWRDEDDYAQMNALVIDACRAGGPATYCSAGDLDWWRYTSSDPNMILRAQLWYLDDTLAGFCWPYGGQADMIVHPQRTAVEPAMVAWLEENHATLFPDKETLGLWSYTGDSARNELFARLRYTRGDDFLRFYLYDLAQPPPEIAPLPDGYTIRPVRGESELEQRVAVHRAAFAPSRMTVEKHGAVMRHALTYRPDLDLVAVAPDGTFAAFTIVWYDAANRMGECEPVGCHPDYQRRGLASAVIVEAMRRVRALGGTHLSIFGFRDDSPGSRLYSHLGFSVVDEVYAWSKPIPHPQATPPDPSPIDPTGATP